MPVNKEYAKKELSQFADRYPIVWDELLISFGNASGFRYDIPEFAIAGYTPRPQMYKDINSTEAAKKEFFNGRIDFYLDKISSKKLFVDAINHEILGHYGLNTFSESHKLVILQAIKESASHKDGCKKLKALWMCAVNDSYGLELSPIKVA
jgi:hypothetical protein